MPLKETKIFINKLFFKSLNTDKINSLIDKDDIFPLSK